MKQTTMFYLLGCIALSSNYIFGMLTNTKTLTKKYVRCNHTKEDNQKKLIQQLLRNNQFNPNFDQCISIDDYHYEYRDTIKHLYVRNDAIIDLLKKQRHVITKNIRTLRKQQALAVQDLSHNENDLKRLEKELQESLISHNETNKD